MLLTAGALINLACDRSDGGQYAKEVERIAAAAPRWISRDALGKRLWAIERRFYEERRWLPAWVEGEHPTPQLDELLETLRDAGLHGLEPAAYGYEGLAAARTKADDAWMSARFAEAQIPDVDLHLTYAFLSEAADLLGWRHSPKEIDPNWLASTKKVDLAKELRQALDKNSVRKTLENLAPQHAQYKGLQAAIARARDGGGADRCQLGKIRMNLERWRWAPHDLGKRHILINVPSYQMQVIEDDQPVLAMRVIVGAAETPTPLFSDEMTYLVFSPYWNIPEKILREETLPRLAEDPDYLVRNSIEVVGTAGGVVDPEDVDWGDASETDSLRFRQTPGPENALGLVKFIFPNHFSVYLHDTPGDALFNQETRTLSHGCIRVEKPVALAEYVLRDSAQWTPERIQAAMTSKEETTVTLKHPIPVHIGYWTAWVEPDGSVKLIGDPYGMDRKQAAADRTHANGGAIASR